MAKKQTFGDKTSKSSANAKNKIKLIKTFYTEKKSVAFSEEMITIPDGKQAEAVLKELINKK